MIRSTSIFKLHVRHDFFADGSWHGIKVLPSRETQRILKRRDLHLRSQPDGMELIRNYRSSEGEGPPPFRTPLCLRFLMVPDDWDYLSHTEMPAFGPIRETVHFRVNSSSLQDGVSPEGLSKRMGPDHIYPLRSKVFHLDGGWPSNSLITILRSGQKIETIHTDVQGRATIDLSRFPEGRFCLKATEKELYVVTTEIPKIKAAACLDLELKGDDPVLLGDGKARVVLSFPTRSVFWMYRIFIGERAIDSLDVKGPDPEVIFEPLSGQVPDLLQTRCFISSRKIPLRDLYQGRYYLEFSTPGGASVKIPLRYPDWKLLAPHPRIEGEYLAQAQITIDTIN